MPSTPESLLLATAGFKSLESERQLVLLARSLDWDTVHSFYYDDPVTGKARELDILAVKVYKLIPEKINPLARVRLPIECKSIENYNLVFALEEGHATEHGYFDWIGYEHTRAKLVRTLKERMSNDLVSMLMQDFDSNAYADDRYIASPIMVNPPAAQNCATAFRELKPTEREIDTSVLWKAVQSLSATLSTLSSSSVEMMIGYILSAFKEDKVVDNRYIYRDVLHWCDIMLTSVNIYHPVIVVQCPMWTWDGHSLSEASHVRLVRRMQGGKSSWYDIVQSNAIPRVLDEISTYYDSLVPKGLEQLRPHLKLKRGAKRRSRST